MSNKRLNFYERNGNTQTYWARVKTVERNKAVAKKFAEQHGFTVPSKISSFLNLKHQSAINGTADKSPPDLEAPITEGLLPEEAQAIQDTLDAKVAEQYLQMFLDVYMAPALGDINYRLGKVTGTKINFTKDPSTGYATVSENEAKTAAQFDIYGRIDTTVNFRSKINIDNKPGLTGMRNFSEYYVNYFFPPYTADAFGERVNSLAKTDKSVLLKSSTELLGVDPNTRVYYDTDDMMSQRGNFTYRSAGFKAVNDNISYLQHVFEKCTGIVSTYLTEWDLSLYIQEGLLTDSVGKKPTPISICNRIIEDNPEGVKDARALSWGVLNSAVSKTAMIGFTPNLTQWNPSDYYLSTYWMPYVSDIRADGLDAYYTRAQYGFGVHNGVNHYTKFKNSTFKNKIKYYDELGAAYSGWYTWSASLPFWKALYTDETDGLSSLDVFHMTQVCNEYNWDDDSETDGIICQLVSILYDDDSSLNAGASGLAGGVDDASSLKIAAGSVSFEIPNSSILNMFKRRKAIQSNAMAMADKNKSGFSTAAGNSNSGASGEKGTSAKSGPIAMLAVDENENGQTAKHTGIPQWNPVLYGGPHGRNYSPKTIQGYFETDNVFLQNLPRVDAVKAINSGFDTTDFKSYSVTDTGAKSNETYYYQSTENNRTSTRSPSFGLHQMRHGACETKKELVEVWNRKSGWFAKVESWVPYEHSYLQPIYRSWSVPYFGWFFKKKYFTLTLIVGFQWATETRWRKRYVWPKKHGTNSTRNGPDTINYTDNYAWFPMGQHIAGTTTGASSVYWNGNRYKEWSSEWASYYRYGNQYRGQYVQWWKRFAYNEKYGCGGNNRRSYSHYHGTRPVYYIMYSNMIEHKLGYYHVWEKVWVDRPVMHSRPFERWFINRVKLFNYSMHTYYSRSWWWNRFASWWWRWSNPFTIQQSIRRTDVTKYKLHLPSGIRTTRSKASYGRPTTYEHVTYNEQDFIDNILGNGPETNPWKKVSFLFGNSSLSDRQNNGPDCLFTVPCKVSTYQYTYTRNVVVGWHRHRCGGCHKDWAPRKYVGTGKYIEVNMWDISRIWSDMTAGAKYHISNDSVGEMLNDAPPESYRRDMINNPFTNGQVYAYANGSLSQWLGNHYRPDYNETSISGWGYMTSIPGLCPNHPITPVFENANEYTTINNLPYLSARRRFDIPLGDLRFMTVRLGGVAGARYASANGSWYWISGVRRYYKEYMDPGLNKAFIKLFTTSTFYKMPEDAAANMTGSALQQVLGRQYMRPILIDNCAPFRNLVKIALYQKSWMERARELFIDTINFDDIKRILDTAVDKTIIAHSVAKDDSFYYEGVKKGDSRNPRSIAYHYWIERATDIFNNTTKDKWKAIFDAKIHELDMFVNRLGNQITKVAGRWTYNDFVAAYNWVRILKTNFLKPEFDSIEEYIYSYLNILYEYRKFFINKRFNKEDGTMWQMRQLESIIPLMLVKKQSVPTFCDDTSTYKRDDNVYGIDMYQVQNSPTAKVAAIQAKNALDEDRTAILYMAVEYTNKAAFDAYIADKDNPKAQKIIYVPEVGKYAKLPNDDHFRLVSKEYYENEKIRTWNASCIKQGRPEKCLAENDIDDCNFKIDWTSYFDANSIIKEDGQILPGEDMKYQSAEAADRGTTPYYVIAENRVTVTGYPVNTPIFFGSNNKIDTAKFAEITKDVVAGNVDIQQALCYSANSSGGGDANDYWTIAIPPSKRPRASGYRTQLKIITYHEQEDDENVEDEVTVNPATGALAYTLWPITEEQAYSFPAIGTDIGAAYVEAAQRMLGTQIHENDDGDAI